MAVHSGLIYIYPGQGADSQTSAMNSRIFWLLYLIASVLAGYDPAVQNQIVGYWGQGANQGPLREYCDSGNVDIVMIAFVNVVTATNIGFNFGNACWGAQCPQLAQDIKHCQSLGIKVLLSIGGDSGLSNYGLTSDDDGVAAAQMMYDMFNPNGNPKVTKVFCDVEVDGFDMDAENRNNNGQIALFQTLRKLWTSKTLLMSGSPENNFNHPGVLLAVLTVKGLCDFSTVQFYSDAAFSLDTDGFDSMWDTWAAYAVQQDFKIFLTLQGEAGNQWHRDLLTTLTLVGNKKRADVFVGFGVWDLKVATEAVDSTLGTAMNYVEGLKKIASGMYDSVLNKRDEL